MAREFARPNTGATGRRRIVPMMGLDFIAGQIEAKGGPIRRRIINTGVVSTPYGVKAASIGGRTRRWSFINFMHVQGYNNWGQVRTLSQAENNARTVFANGVKSANATLQDLMVITPVQQDFINNTPRLGCFPSDYATLRGWVTAVRIVQKAGATDTTWPPTPNP